MTIDVAEMLGVPGRQPGVGKYEAIHPRHLRGIIAELDDVGMSRVADTIIWLVWHERLHFGNLAEERAENARLRAALAAAPRWVSVTERLPEADKSSTDLLALMDNGRWWHALYDGRWLEYDAEMGEWVSVMRGVTHWLELPPAPEVTP